MKGRFNMSRNLITQNGYDFYEVASALQKAIRRSDTELSGYFALELFPTYHKYVWKRLLTISAEDCYGPYITQEVKALHDSFLFVNQGKKRDNMGGRVFISKAIILLAGWKHNRDADLLSNFIYDKQYGISDDEINAYFDEVRKEQKEIPDYAYDKHTWKGKMMGDTVEDFIVREQREMTNVQQSIFDIEGVTD